MMPEYEVKAHGDGSNGGGPKKVDTFRFYSPTINKAVLTALRWFGSAQTYFTLWRDGELVYTFDPDETVRRT